jgi:hypothetical protein
MTLCSTATVSAKRSSSKSPRRSGSHSTFPACNILGQPNPEYDVHLQITIEEMYL